MTKAEIVSVRALHDKKGRAGSGLFLVEGRKAVDDIVNSALVVETIYCLESFRETFVKSLPLSIQDSQIVAASTKEMERISFLKTPSEVIALVVIPQRKIDMARLSGKLSIILDGVQDPGNLGTIIRLADWFGIEDVICSPDSADCFNPKVVQATMGAISRVKVHYTPLAPFLESVSNFDNFSASGDGVAIYGTFLDGTSIYERELSTEGLIVMGSEGRGISREVESFINHRLFIPPYPSGVPTSESLNVAVATAVVCSEFRRRG